MDRGTNSGRPVVALDSADLGALTAALDAALDGTGPAVAPMPAAPSQVLDSLGKAVRPDLPLESDDVAVVLATSGSTGQPKGVLLSSAALQASARATAHRLGGDGQWLLALDPGHIAGLQVVLRSLLAGTDPVAIGAGAFRPEQFTIAAESMTGSRRYTSLVPTQLRRIVDAGGRALDALRSFDAVLVGGAATPAPLLESARGHGVRIRMTYGMSETAGGCVYDGVPLDGVEVTIADDGRIVLGGPVLASGYRLRPDLTVESFGGGVFRTSDLGSLDQQGVLTIHGRADDVVVSGGENVALVAVERAALTMPCISEAAAFGRPDPEWGTQVELAVVPTGAAPTLAEVVPIVAASLGRAAAPKRLHVLTELPLLPSGKLDRAALGNLPL